MNKRNCLAAALIISLAAGAVSAQTKDGTHKQSRTTRIDITALPHATADRNAPAVYFSREISSESIVRLYNATGKKLTGRIALKVIFEGPNTQYIDPALLTGLVKETNGTFIDSTYFTSPRNRPAGSLRMATEHGWDKIAPCEIIDAEGDIDLPVKNGNILKYFRVGKGFAKYDSAVAVNLFKPHYIEQYDGITKALSIPFGSRSGKAILHSGGKVEDRYTAGDWTEFKMAVADAVKAAVDYNGGNWIFINILADINTDDNCTDAVPPGSIGVLASTDPVAIDRAACDMTFAQGTAAQCAAWEKRHGVDVLDYAEKIGAGKQHYRIIEIR